MTHQEKVYVVAAGILVAGVIQLLAPLPALLRLGFRFHWAWKEAKPRVVEVARTMVPIMLGLSITQLNTLSDSLIAWSFSPAVSDSTHAIAEAKRDAFRVS